MKFVGVIFLVGIFFYGVFVLKPHEKITQNQTTPSGTLAPTKAPEPLSIEAMKKKSYPGSALTVVKELPNGVNFKRYIVSYLSDGLKIEALLSVPIGTKPNAGWPVILFNHGYIPPQQYVTATSYASIVDPLAQAGYIVLKPDYRGNGNSEGQPEQPYVSAAYVTDSMNALASIKKYPDANPAKIGVMGHSMGGNITMHTLVITKDFKAAEIVAGVVGNETELLSWWDKRLKARSIVGNDLDTNAKVKQMIAEHGSPSTNQSYWNSLDPNSYLSDVTTALQLQVGSGDTVVPPEFTQSLRDRLKNAGKTVDYTLYPGADHNLKPDLPVALSKAVAFFDSYLK